MGIDNFIETAMSKVLKNPILQVLGDINFSSILKQSKFIKRDIGVISFQYYQPISTYLILELSTLTKNDGTLNKGSMELFLKILENLLQATEIVKRNKDLEKIIQMLRVYT